MKKEEIVREVQSLRRKVQGLGKEIEALKAIVLEDPSPVEKMIRMRGLQVSKKNPTDQLFFPPDLPPDARDRFYEMMHRYSFRLILRDMIKHQNRFRIQDLTHYCSTNVARRYCTFLSEMGLIVSNGRDTFRTMISPLHSFGQTLEWFVAEMFKKEFASPAIYRAILKGTVSGGDYDVVASWNRKLVYVEVKSSPPKGVELGEVSTFFSRIDELLPEVAILFEDTQLRMKDKLVVLFEEELQKRYGDESKRLYPVERLIEELFHVRHRIFIVNSKRDAAENFSICLNHYLRFRYGGR